MVLLLLFTLLTSQKVIARPMVSLIDGLISTLTDKGMMMSHTDMMAPAKAGELEEAMYAGRIED